MDRFDHGRSPAGRRHVIRKPWNYRSSDLLNRTCLGSFASDSTFGAETELSPEEPLTSFPDRISTGPSTPSGRNRSGGSCRHQRSLERLAKTPQRQMSWVYGAGIRAANRYNNSIGSSTRCVVPPEVG